MHFTIYNTVEWSEEQTYQSNYIHMALKHNTLPLLLIYS